MDGRSERKKWMRRKRKRGRRKAGNQRCGEERESLRAWELYGLRPL